MDVKKFLALVAGVASLLPATGTRAGATCDARDRRLVVLTSEEQMLLCDGTRVIRTFDVHLGRGGVGKTRQGDNKVPIGVYPLGAPRKSEKFWMFIPIGYPTPEQRTRGLTGRDVGVHGPHRLLSWLGPLTNTVSSTAGCIGLGKNDEIEEVSAWVKKMKVRTIDIR
jgi:murein L,D-transpeptidase YafK